MDKPKKCPNGKKATLLRFEGFQFPVFWVQCLCEEIHFSPAFKSGEEAIRAWNRIVVKGEKKC